MRIEWRSIDDLVAAVRANISHVRAMKPEIVVGIPRSGMLPASQIALALGLPLADLHSFCAGRGWKISGGICGEAAGARRVLLVDDATGFCKAMKGAMASLAEDRPDCTVMTCAVYATAKAAERLDIYFEECPHPRIFEWNWWRSRRLKGCCVDIDGVLCVDPTRAQNRNPGLYRQFLADASPLFLTAKPVHALVTGRKEAYREETERWLRRHGIEYGKLKMLEVRSPRSAEGHAERKAEFYQASPARLFIESSDRQAELIAEISGKDSLCITTRRLYRGKEHLADTE